MEGFFNSSSDNFVTSLAEDSDILVQGARYLVCLSLAFFLSHFYRFSKKMRDFDDELETLLANRTCLSPSNAWKTDFCF